MQIELIAKTIIYNPEGAILVLRRHDKDTHRPGGWDLPGGQVEPGEDPVDAAVREAQEETGLQLHNLHPIHVTSRIHGSCHVVKTVFMTNEYTGPPILSHEHDAFKWLTTSEFDHLTISNDYKAAAKSSNLRLLARI